MISVVINADTRQGWQNEQSAVGDYTDGFLHGVRSVDFLLDGVQNKMDYFRGHSCECILYIDQHEPLPDELFMQVVELVKSYGNNSQVVIKSHDRIKYRWNDYLYIESLKLATGDYIAHFDNDANAFRVEGSNIIEKYLSWLEEYKFVCQPTDLPKEEHGMFWASSRFFICKRETLSFVEIESNLTSPLKGRHTPCFEHVISVLNDESVLYPPREDDKYIVFCWARYFKGTMKKLNKMQPEQALKYIFRCGIHGANDCLDKNFIDE